MKHFSESQKGIVYFSSSALFFSLASVFVKLVTIHSDIGAIQITFYRFLLGFVVVSTYILMTGKSLRPKRPSFVIARAVFNTAAVLLFFLGVQFTTITNANLLNMTYPVFVFLVAPIVNKEHVPKFYYLFLLLTAIGMWLVITPDFGVIRTGDILSLLSGVVAGISIAVLREARKYDDSYVILFYLMCFGTLLTFIFKNPFSVKPEGVIALYCFLTAFMAVLGQVFITLGFRFITAAQGSLISTSRIIFAALFGVVIFSDALTIKIILGGILIIVSLIGISWSSIKRARNMEHGYE